MKTIGIIMVTALLGMVLFVGCSSTGTHHTTARVAPTHQVSHIPCGDKLCVESMR